MPATQKVAIVGTRAVTLDGVTGPVTVLLENGKIAAFTTDAPPTDADVIPADGLFLLPGFIDVHIHGGGGADTMDGTPEALRTICRTHARYGTTGILATTMTQSREKITAALKNARLAYEAGANFCPDGAQVLGIHLEGPYISPERPGAQPKEYVRDYDVEEFAEWLAVAGDALKLITLAPERPGADALIVACQEAGIVVSMGHTDANAAQTKAALDSGVSHATHLFNAMPSIHHRRPGPIPVLLSRCGVLVELIADGHHIAPEVIEMVLAAKDIQEVILITDAMSGAGAGDGLYDLGGHAVTVADGRATLSDGTLAGSVLTMAQAAKNVDGWLGLDVAVGDAKRWMAITALTSRNAALEMARFDKCGILVGKDADLVLVDNTLNVHATFVAGRCVYHSTE
jgi:N-acetylglucosamine-6-phosphate deacetylase